MSITDHVDEIQEAIDFARSKGCPVLQIKVRSYPEVEALQPFFPEHTIAVVDIINPWMLMLECGYTAFNGNERTHITRGVMEKEKLRINADNNPLWGIF